MKKILKYVMLFLVSFVLFYLLSEAKIADNISPFAISFLFALSRTLKYNMGVLFSYFLARVISDLTPLGIIVVVVEILANFGLILLRRLIKENAKTILYAVGLVVVQIPCIFIFQLRGMEIINFTISIILSELFFYLFIKLLSAVKNRGIKTDFAVDELFAIFILIVGVTLGAECLKISNINAALIITILSLIILSNLSSIYPVVFYAVSAGLAYMIAFNQFNYFVCFIIWAMIILLFRDTPKIVGALMLVAVDVCLGLVFKVYPDYSLSNFLIVCSCGIVNVCITHKVAFKIRNRLEFVKPTEGQLDKYFRKSVKQRLSSFVSLLYDIDGTYKDMVVPISSFNKSKQNLATEVCKTLCRDCINRKTCYEKNRTEIESEVEKTLEIGIKKGEVKVLDMPNRLARCSNYSLLLRFINQASKRYLGLVKEVNASNMGKIAIGNQLRGVADALKDFSSTMLFETRADRTHEKKYLSELLYNDIIAEDCQIITHENGEFESLMVLLKLDVDKVKFLKITEKYFKTSLRITENKYSPERGWQILSLEKKPKYGFTFGSATIGQNGKVINGDSHSCTKLSGGKFLLSIADGKGHGKSAEKTSNLTMKLIENFYKANISTETVVTSVNQILSFNNNENFSAVDLCIVNLNDGEADFIKLGSTPTLIKRGDRVRVVNSESLPIGVCKLATSTTDKEFLSVGDIVVMTSDGVFDGFETIENFAGFVNNLRLVNMELLAKSLLEESVRRSGGKIRDDLTVLAFRWLVDF